MKADRAVDAQLAKEHGLSADEFAQLLERLGRTPTLEELGMISVLWSEHCSYKSSKIHLKRLPTKAPWVLQGPGENAGVIDVGGGLAVAFKMESHNHPSFIEPYQGAATGVGGIMRDVFTMGARPIANMNSLRFGDPATPRMPFLVSGVVAGIGGYGNCMGVPTVGGEVAFDASYDGNILVNAFTLGVLAKDRIFLSEASGPGNSLVYVGSKTGRDGIHGATMASEEFGKDSEAKRPRVQVGDPFTEKTLLEACLELMKEDVIVAIQDMGAAGLTSSSVEMAAKGGVGVEIDVSKVPRREEGMTPYEVLLSESQERMLMVVRKGSEDVVRAIFEKWDLDACVVGTIVEGDRVVVKDGDEVVVDLPIDVFTDSAPAYDRPRKAPLDLEALWKLPEIEARPAKDRLVALLARPTIASKRWVYEQYDSSVRCGTIVGPGAADAAVVRLPDADGTPHAGGGPGVAMSTDMNGRFVRLDPKRGAALGLLEGARNLACVGAQAKAATDCLNFGNPEKPEVMWSFSEAIDGLAEACAAMETPIVSGNVSFYNETEGRPILPTPTLGVVGVIGDIKNALSMSFKADKDRIFVLGPWGDVSLAGSELLLMETDELRGRPPAPDYGIAKAVHKTCIEASERGLLKSAHDVSEGGFLAALAECCVGGSGLGARIRNLPDIDPTVALFGEGPSVIIVSAAEQHAEALIRMAEENGAPIIDAGVVAQAVIEVEGLATVPVSELEDAWSNGLVRALGIDGERSRG